MVKGMCRQKMDDNLGMYGKGDVSSTTDYNLVMYCNGVCSQTCMII